VLVDPDELAPFVPLATKSIEVEEFVDLAEIDPVFFETTYYVAPASGPKPYALWSRRCRAPEGGDEGLHGAPPAGLSRRRIAAPLVVVWRADSWPDFGARRSLVDDDVGTRRP
jgi:hypothetical protein